MLEKDRQRGTRLLTIDLFQEGQIQAREQVDEQTDEQDEQDLLDGDKEGFFSVGS